jgi:hypothetical protein
VYEEYEWKPQRAGFRYVVARIVYADFAGIGYAWAKSKRGTALRFWTRNGAQAHADGLNAALRDKGGGQ